MADFLDLLELIPEFFQLVDFLGVLVLLEHFLQLAPLQVFVLCVKGRVTLNFGEHGSLVFGGELHGHFLQQHEGHSFGVGIVGKRGEGEAIFLHFDVASRLGLWQVNGEGTALWGAAE